MRKKSFLLGVDIGTSGVRSVIVDTTDGKIVGLSINNFKDFPNTKRGVITRKNTPQLSRQYPQEFIEDLHSFY